MTQDSQTPMTCAEAERAFWSGDYARAIPRLEQLLAEKQHGAAMVLAQAYHYGRGVGMDLAKSVALYRQAVDMGNGFAALMLALTYANPEGTNPPDLRKFIPHDPSKADRYARIARKLFEPLVEANDPVATQGLANLYEFGLIQPLDLRRALALYKKSYELGTLFAANNIAALLYDSDDPEIRDIVEARRWYELAREHNVLRTQIEEFDTPTSGQ